MTIDLSRNYSYPNIKKVTVGVEVASTATAVENNSTLRRSHLTPLDLVACQSKKPPAEIWGTSPW